MGDDWPKARIYEYEIDGDNLRVNYSTEAGILPFRMPWESEKAGFCIRCRSRASRIGSE
ncbi:MAG: hypothetical protein ACI835_004234 [Planctomycetota bacterium]|jgi:hypothetical protein